VDKVVENSDCNTKYYVLCNDSYGLAKDHFFTCYNWVGFMFQVKALHANKFQSFLNVNWVVTINSPREPSIIYTVSWAVTVILLFISPIVQTPIFSFFSELYNL
jgi:hypothetical protein